MIETEIEMIKREETQQNYDLIEYYIYNGKLDKLKQYINNFNKKNKNISNVSNHLKILFPYNSIDIACIEGHMDIILFLHNLNPLGYATYRAMDNACEYGHFNIVKWLHYNRKEGCSKKAMDNACKNGHLDIVKWLNHNRTEDCTKNAFRNAVYNNHIDVIDWLFLNRREYCHKNVIIYPALQNNIQLLEYLHKLFNNETYDRIIYVLSSHNNLELIKYFHYNFEIPRTYCIQKAALTGNLKIVKFLHKVRNEYCENNLYIFYKLLSYGYFHIARYLYYYYFYDKYDVLALPKPISDYIIIQKKYVFSKLYNIIDNKNICLEIAEFL